MNKILKTFFALIIALIMNSANAVENNANGAKAFVQATSTEVISLVEHIDSMAKTERTLDHLFIEVTDIDWIGKYVIGQQWKSLNDSQKTTYLTKYRNFLVSLYVPLFKDYNGQKIQIKGAKDLGEDQYLVTSEIQPNDENKPRYKVEYRLKFINGGFKIRDIIAEGVSLLATQRSEFSSIINNNGFDALINKLQQKGSKVNIE